MIEFLQALQCARLKQLNWLQKDWVTKKNDITIEGHLYSSNVEAILNLIDSTANKINSLLIVGHNPEISGLASYLSGKSISMDTCSMVELIFEIKDWDGINKNNLVKINLLN